MVDGKPVTGGTVANDALTYTQTSETRRGGSIRTYVTDPERATVLIKVRFESRDGEDHDVEIEFDPQLYNDGDDDVGWTRGPRAAGPRPPHRLRAGRPPSLTRTSSGYKGREESTLLEHTYDALRPGNVVQQAHTRLTGRGERRDLTLALGFAQVASQALSRRQGHARAGLGRHRRRLPDGWITYRNTLFPIPAAALPVAAAYETSLFMLKAHEDKDNRGRVRGQPEPGLGRAAIDEDNALGPVPPGAGARPLPRRHRAARRGRQGRREPRAGLPARAAGRRRLVPGRTRGRRTAEGRRGGDPRRGCRSCSSTSSAAREPDGATSAAPRTHRRQGPGRERSAGRTGRYRRRRSRRRSRG